MPEIETQVIPPDTACDGGDEVPSAQVSVSWLDTHDVYRHAAVTLPGESAEDPEKFAESLLSAALALANLCGPDAAWATMQRFRAYGRQDSTS